MKTWIPSLVIYIFGSLGGFCADSAGTNQFEIVWAVPTNRTLSSVWVYKIVPQNFASPVINNLMALGAFTTNNLVTIKGQSPYSMYFNSGDKLPKMGIVPAFGWIFYYNSGAEAKGHEIPIGVPSEEETYQMGVEYIQKLGLDRTQFATQGDSSKLRVVKTLGGRTWQNKVTETNVEQTYMRGIHFIRRVNGIDFDGAAHGGVYMEFGNHGQISRLEVLWKGLEPYQLHQILTPPQLLEELRTGQGKWLRSGPGRFAKRITIYDVEPLYRGVLEDDEKQKFVEPFMRLETKIDTGFTNFLADFDCPIYSQKNPE